jgi:uncharacterized OB-fold protein
MERKVFKEGIMKETDHGPVLLALKCKNCGQLVFPPEGEVCTNCLSTEYDTVELPQTGTLRFYTVHYRPVNTPFPVPHAIGQVDLGGIICVYAPLKIEGEMKKGDEFKMGSKIQIIEDDYYTLKDGTTIYGYKFKVVD